MDYAWLIPLDMAAGLSMGFQRPYRGWAVKHGLDVNHPLTWEMFRHEMLLIAAIAGLTKQFYSQA